MLNSRMPGLLVAAFAALVAAGGYSGTTFADSAQDATNKAMQDQMREMAKRIEELTKQVESLSKKPEKPQAAATGGPPAAAVAKEAPAEPKLEKLLKGFYGNMDVSFDDTTKGIAGLVAYPYSLVDPANPQSGYVQGTTPKSGPVGRVGWMPALSTNKTGIGYRGSHKIDGTDVEFVYQFESNMSLTSSPGSNTSYTQQANVVKSALGFGDSFIGFKGKDWGTVKFGTQYSPYKKSTDRMNPTSGMLGDYAVVMGNSGGDNRVEFGTRLDHSIVYEAPKIAGISIQAMISPGQNRTFDNVVQSSGSPDCSGGNMPGSGNLVLNCDDGGFGDAYGVTVNFEMPNFYATVDWERHKNVNRNSDGEGSNNPIYGWFTNTYPNEVITATNNPQGLPGSALGGYVHDIGDESATKVGVQYKFPFGLTLNAIYEWLRRDIPAILEFQNERSRNGYWLAFSQTIAPNGELSAGWAHAAKTPGDPGGQHNYNPLAPANTADMYTIAFKYKIDKQMTWYIDAAETINHGNAHYDLGAGGRGLTTDCHDGTNTVFVDYSGTGPTTWGGCKVQGFSTGISFKF
jgi:predicted porin